MHGDSRAIPSWFQNINQYEYTFAQKLLQIMFILLDHPNPPANVAQVKKILDRVAHLLRPSGRLGNIQALCGMGSWCLLVMGI